MKQRKPIRATMFKLFNTHDVLADEPRPRLLPMVQRSLANVGLVKTAVILGMGNDTIKQALAWAGFDPNDYRRPLYDPDTMTARMAYAQALRRAGYTYPQIGRLMGITKQGAQHLVERARERRLPPGHHDRVAA